MKNELEMDDFDRRAAKGFDPADTMVDFDEIENDRIEADIREILGDLGGVSPLRSLETDDVIGWVVFNGAVTIERDDLPVCSGEVEGELTRDHRRSLLGTIKKAHLAGCERLSIRQREAALLLAFAAQRLVNAYGEDANADVIRAMRGAVDHMAPPMSIELPQDEVQLDGRTA